LVNISDPTLSRIAVTRRTPKTLRIQERGVKGHRCQPSASPVRTITNGHGL